MIFNSGSASARGQWPISASRHEMRGAVLKSIAQGNPWEYGGATCRSGTPPDLDIVKRHQGGGQRNKTEIYLNHISSPSLLRSLCCLYQLEVLLSPVRYPFRTPSVRVTNERRALEDTHTRAHACQPAVSDMLMTVGDAFASVRRQLKSGTQSTAPCVKTDGSPQTSCRTSTSKLL